MKRPLEVLRGRVSPARARRSARPCRSERTVMLATILLMSAASAATGYLLTQCTSVDVLSSLLWLPEDCWLDWGMNIGRHCFSDYAIGVDGGMRPDPWDYSPVLPIDMMVYAGGPAAEMIPYLLFGLPAKWLGAPRLGLVLYLLALTIAAFSPAVWASRGARGLERVVVFVALGAAAIPVWAVIDRGNSAGFVVPIALVFLLALCRQRWGLATVMVVLAALVKPQFVVLSVALLAARQWRWGGIAFVGAGLSHFAAYLLWPRAFPESITRSIDGVSSLSTSFGALIDMRNLSFGRALLLIPDAVKGAQSGEIPDGFLAGPRSLIGYAVLLVLVVCVVALGRRIPPVMAGILLLAVATLFPPFTGYYYLVFVLPIAALVVRDPDGPPGAGIFDRLATEGRRRRAVGMWVSVAAALSIAQVAIPFLASRMPIVVHERTIGYATLITTTAILAPTLWLVTCAVIIGSYGRRPADLPGSDPSREGSDAAGATSSPTSELMTGSSQLGQT